VESGGFQLLWEDKLAAMVLLIPGVVIFVFLLVDTWRHGRHRKRNEKLNVPQPGLAVDEAPPHSLSARSS
jgi:hypothetical protein